MLGDILVRLAAFAVLGFLFLVSVGLWDRYEREAAALGFSGVYEHYLASRAGFAGDPQGYRGGSAVRFMGNASSPPFQE
jgi:hypothetical protein